VRRAVAQIKKDDGLVEAVAASEIIAAPLAGTR